MRRLSLAMERVLVGLGTVRVLHDCACIVFLYVCVSVDLSCVGLTISCCCVAWGLARCEQGG